MTVGEGDQCFCLFVFGVWGAAGRLAAKSNPPLFYPT